jgi:hypothetical protein
MWPARGEALMADWALSAKAERKDGTGILRRMEGDGGMDYIVRTS